MANSIFIAAQSDISLRFKEKKPLMHVFGGVCRGDSSVASIQTGIDFGGNKKRDFSTKGTLATARARQALLLPITERSAALFSAYVANFKALKRRGLLPFYFSRDRGVIPSQEVRGVPPIDLYGQEMAFDEEEVHDYQVFVSKSNRTRERPHAEGLIRSRAACAVFFNFATELSGIDLNRVHPEWMDIQNGDEFSARLHAVFNDAVPNTVLRKGIDFRTLKGGVGVVLRVQDDFSEIPMNEIISSISEYFGGFDRFSEYFNAREPLYGEPLPTPDYIQDAIARLEH